MIKGRISGKIVMMMMMMKDINHLMMNMKIREEADTNMRRERGKSDKMKSKGENKRFHEKVQYQERHFKDN